MNAMVTKPPVKVMTANEVLRSEGALIDTMRASLYPGAREDSVAMVIAYCHARRLDPLQKPVHIVPMNVKVGRDKYEWRDVILPGIALYRIQAARTGDYVGKSSPSFGPDETYELSGVTVRVPEWCEITVQRLVHGKERSFTAREYWIENYATGGGWVGQGEERRKSDAPNAMWQKRARGQLMKVAEAQALRMAFPEETGGEATAEEMEGKEIVVAPTGPVIDGESAAQPEKPAAPPAPEWVMWGPKPDAMGPDDDMVAASSTAQSAKQWARWADPILAAIVKTEKPENIVLWREKMGPVLAALMETRIEEVMDAVRRVMAAAEDASERMKDAAALRDATLPADEEGQDGGQSEQGEPGEAG